MKKSAIWVLVAITLIFAAFVGGFYLGRNANHAPVQVSTLPPFTATEASASATVPVTTMGKININDATYEELQLVPGIGPALAGRIIEYRKTYGPFASISDLAKVRGISDSSVLDMAPYITV